MNKRQFLQLIDKYYFNYDLREIRVTIWTGQSSVWKYFDSWISVDCYNKDGDFISEIDDYLRDLYCDIPALENVDNSTLEERQSLMKDHFFLIHCISFGLTNRYIQNKCFYQDQLT